MGNEQFTILIADDSKMDVAILCDCIAAQDRKLVCVYSGKAVFEYLRDDIPDLILLDVVMPDMNGYEVCQRLKQQEITKHVPVIFLTSLTDITNLAKGFEVGAVDYIAKPYHLVEINARIKNHLLLGKKHEKFIERIGNFINAVSEIVIMSRCTGEIVEVFGDYIRFFPQMGATPVGKNLADVLSDSFYRQLCIAVKTMRRTKEAFEFETEIFMEGGRHVLLVTISQADSSGMIGTIIADVTERRLAERKVDLTYEYQKRSRFFNNILGDDYNGEQQARLLSVYGIEYRKPLICYMLSISVSESKLYSTENFQSSVGEWLLERGYGWIWSGPLGIGILMQHPNETSEIERIAASLKESLEMRFPEIIVHIGIARTESAELDFKQVCHDTLGAVLTAVGEKRGYVLAQPGKSGLNELLLCAMEHMDIDRFIDQVLGKIKKADHKNGGDLMGTLEQLIVAPSVKAAAGHLFVHPNTVLWRKQKIEEILEMSLDDMDTRTQINLALKFMRIRSIMHYVDASGHL